MMSLLHDSYIRTNLVTLPDYPETCGCRPDRALLIAACGKYANSIAGVHACVIRLPMGAKCGKVTF